MGGHLGFLAQKARKQQDRDREIWDRPPPCEKLLCRESPSCVVPAPVPARGSAWGGSITQRGLSTASWHLCLLTGRA